MTSRPTRLTAPAGRLAAVAALLGVLLTLTLPGRPALAAPSPAPSVPATAACAAKAPSAVAWCMPWAVRVTTPPTGGRSHWVTRCSLATTDADRNSCAAASITLALPPRDGSPSVLGDGPSSGSGPAGLVSCELMTGQTLYDTDPAHAAQWKLKYDACAAQKATWARQVYDPDPKPADCGLTDVSCQIQRKAQDAFAGGIRSGIQGLTDTAVLAMVYLLSKLASLVFSATSISSPDDAFYATYNSVAGVMVLMIMVFFLISLIVNGLRTSAGPGPMASLGGLVRALLGITFAGGIAFLIVTAWDQATNAVIAANATTPWDPSLWVQSLTRLTGGVGTLFLALLLSIFGCFGLLLLFFIMLFRGILATGAALFGAVAMAGQVMHETRSWGRRWFWTVNALASSKFVIAELWIYGSRSAYGSDDLMTVLRAVLLIWLMVAAPWILLRLTTIWDGYLSDPNAYGLLSAAGNPLAMGPAFNDGVRSGAAGAFNPGSGSSGGDSSAAGVMAANGSSLPTTPSDAAGVGGDSSGRKAADAASTGGDGGQVGQPGSTPGDDQGGGQADNPNGQEAAGVEAGARSAQQSVATGTLTAPGSTGGGTAASSAGPAAPDLPGMSDPTGSGAATPGPPPAGGGESNTSSSGGESPGGGGSAASGSHGAAAAAAETPIVPL